MVNNANNKNESKGDRKSKSTNTSGLFVRDFNTVREIMRSIYLYGCYDKSDYINKEGVLKFKTGTSKGNISRSKVEIEIGRFGFLLGEDFFDAYDSTYHCNYDLFSRVDDAMLTMYRNRTFTRLDIQSYILLLQSLNQLEEDGTYKKISISDIFTFINAEHSKAISMSNADELSCKGNSKPMYYDIAKSKLRDELASLVNLGLINELDISSHTHLYQLKDDIFEDFSNQELRNIYRYLDYCGRCLALQTPFYFAKKKIGLYLKSERNDDSEINNHMVYRHNFIYNGLDNDIAIRLLMGIHENRAMELKIYDNSSNTIKIINVIPIKIVHDLWTGKQDALYYELESETAKTCSLDNIYAATLLDEALAKVWNKAKEACEVIHETWRTSLYNEYGKQNVLIEFNIPEDNKQAYKRLYYEGVVDHKGKLTNTDKKDQYLFEIDVLDSYDMLTWIKSFCEMATVIRPKHLVDRIKSTWQTSLSQMKDDKNLVYDGPHLEAGLTPSVVVDENTIFLKEENFVYEAMCRLINEKVDKNDIFVDDEEVFKAVGLSLGRNIRKGILDFDDDDHKYYDLLGKVDDKYFIRLFRKVPIRLNNLEKEALYNAACLNQALYFLEKETIDKIKKIINEDEIRWSLDDILYKNRNDEPEVFNEGLYSDVRLFEKAISLHQAIECTLSDEKGNEKRVRCYPALMDYYAAKGHMNAILYLKDIDDFLHVTFAQIKDLKMIEGDTIELRDRYLQYMGQNRIKASFEIIPNASAIDRVLRLFSFYPRDMKYNPDSNLYTMTIHYFKEDYHILQKDILSAGRYVRVLSHDQLKKDIHDRTQKALSNYE